MCATVAPVAVSAEIVGVRLTLCHLSYLSRLKNHHPTAADCYPARHPAHHLVVEPALVESVELAKAEHPK